MVDEKRIQELTDKRYKVGLSDEEADELGGLFAEQEGKPYSNAKLSKLPPGERGADVAVEEPADEPGRGSTLIEEERRQLKDVPVEELMKEARGRGASEETGSSE